MYVINPENNILYQENGFFQVQNIIDSEICNHLNKALLVLDSKMDNSFFTSSYSPDVDYKLKVDEIIRKAIPESIFGQYIGDASLFYANFLSKIKGEYSECVMHNDWSIVDESIIHPFHLWIPLVDVNINNGTLAFVKGSHKLTNVYRGLHTKHYYDSFYPKLRNTNATYMEVKAGTGVFYHPGLIHFSPPNITDERRTAILLSFYPNNSIPIIYYRNKWNWNGKIDVYELTKLFYSHWDKKSKPTTKYLTSKKEIREPINFNTFIQSL